MLIIQVSSLILVMLNLIFVMYCIQANKIGDNISTKDEDFNDKVKEFWRKSNIIDKAYHILNILAIIYVLNIIYQAYMLFIK